MALLRKLELPVLIVLLLAIAVVGVDRDMTVVGKIILGAVYAAMMGVIFYKARKGGHV